MALILEVDSLTKVTISINLEQFRFRLIEADAFININEGGDDWAIDWNKFIKCVQEMNKDSYFLIRPGSMNRRKVIINAPRDFDFFREPLSNSSSGV